MIILEKEPIENDEDKSGPQLNLQKLNSFKWTRSIFNAMHDYLDGRQVEFDKSINQNKKVLFYTYAHQCWKDEKDVLFLDQWRVVPEDHINACILHAYNQDEAFGDTPKTKENIYQYIKERYVGVSRKSVFNFFNDMQNLKCPQTILEKEPKKDGTYPLKEILGHHIYFKKTGEVLFVTGCSITDVKKQPTRFDVIDKSGKKFHVKLFPKSKRWEFINVESQTTCPFKQEQQDVLPTHTQPKPEDSS